MNPAHPVVHGKRSEKVRNHRGRVSIGHAKPSRKMAGTDVKIRAGMAISRE